MLATPRGITQPHTSFIGSACQGIHHAPLTNKHKKLVRATHTKSHKKNRKKHTPTTPTTTPGQQVPINEMLASTIQFSHNTPHHQSTTPQPPPKRINQEQQPTARSTGTHTRVVPDTRQHANAPYKVICFLHHRGRRTTHGKNRSCSFHCR